MKEYIQINKNEEFKNVTVCFQNEMEKPLRIGRKMCELNEEAYMNGYNWDALFNYYLAKHSPELLVELEPAPEGGSYFAHYPLNSENEKKAEKFAEIIIDLIENEDKLYEFVKNETKDIEWD